MATTITLSVSGDDLLTIFGLSFGPLVMSTTTLVYRDFNHLWISYSKLALQWQQPPMDYLR